MMMIECPTVHAFPGQKKTTGHLFAESFQCFRPAVHSVTPFLGKIAREFSAEKVADLPNSGIILQSVKLAEKIFCNSKNSMDTLDGGALPRNHCILWCPTYPFNNKEGRTLWTLATESKKMNDSKQAFDFLKKKGEAPVQQSPPAPSQVTQADLTRKPELLEQVTPPGLEGTKSDLSDSGIIIDTPYSIIRAEYAVMEEVYEKLLLSQVAKAAFREWLATSPKLAQLNTMITKRLMEQKSPKNDEAKMLLQLKAIMTLWRQEVRQKVVDLVTEQPREEP